MKWCIDAKICLFLGITREHTWYKCFISIFCVDHFISYDLYKFDRTCNMSLESKVSDLFYIYHIIIFNHIAYRIIQNYSNLSVFWEIAFKVMPVFCNFVSNNKVIIEIVLLIIYFYHDMNSRVKWFLEKSQWMTNVW